MVSCILDQLWIGDLEDAVRWSARDLDVLVVSDEWPLDEALRVPHVVWLPLLRRGEFSVAQLSAASHILSLFLTLEHDAAMLIADATCGERVVAVLMAYFIYRRGMDEADALKLIQTQRPSAVHPRALWERPAEDVRADTPQKDEQR